MKKTKLPEAESAMRVFRTRSGGDRAAIFWLAWALYEQNKLDDALYHFELCIQNYETSGKSEKLGRSYAGKGFTLIKMGRNSEARTAFEFAIYFHDNQPDVKALLSTLP